jgi:2-polyprenyl-3-methyl-5-hydroxy-6-metoxy-1,4-benzoquinol methylase
MLWRLFQYCVGGTVDKRRLSMMKYRGQKRVLEVGCSVGNISRAFQTVPEIEYTGIDIDPVVIDYARKAFSSLPGFRFLCMDLCDFAASSDERFDYLLFAGVLHHVDDETCLRMLRAVWPLMADDGTLVIVDPVMPTSEDSWFMHWFLKLEQGEHVRRDADVRGLVRSVVGFQLEEVEIHYVGATPVSVPKCARFGVYKLSKV